MLYNKNDYYHFIIIIINNIIQRVKEGLESSWVYVNFSIAYIIKLFLNIAKVHLKLMLFFLAALHGSFHLRRASRL